MSRIAGISLLALGVACWPRSSASQWAGMLTYSAMATLYLLLLGLRGAWIGPLLWPAVAAHAVLTALLIVAGHRAVAIRVYNERAAS